MRNRETLSRVEASGPDKGSAPGVIFEIKYAVPIGSRYQLQSALRHYGAVPAEFPFSRIKTLYFDDSADKSFFESIDGELEKRKYRLRYYIGSEGARYSVEVKLRSNTVTRKVKQYIHQRLPEGYRITGFRALIDALEGVSNRSLAALRAELPRSELFPSTTINYQRHRFDDLREEARYNVDTHITVSPDLSAPDAGHGFRLDHDIFEIKTTNAEFFPSYLKGLGLEPVSFSKFVWGRETLG